jgi:hypothetical protein
VSEISTFVFLIKMSEISMNELQSDVLNVELSDPQMVVLSSTASITLDMAGQGGGKSRNIGYDTGMMIQEFPRAKGFIGANTQTQLSQSTLSEVFATWEAIYGFTQYDKGSRPSGTFVVDRRPPSHWVRSYTLRDYRGTISFWNGALIFIGSLENYFAHDGKQFAWAHLDETKDTVEDAVTKVILGRLRQYGLWYDQDGNLYWDENKENEAENLAFGLQAFNPLKIHTSPAEGVAPWINKMFSLGKFQKEIKQKCQARGSDFFHKEFDGKCVVIYSAYHNEKNLPPGHLQQKQKNLNNDDVAFMLIDAYPFSKTGGECYPAFSREKHVKKVRRVPGHTVLQAWDFNVLPHMTCLCCTVRVVVRFINEVGSKFDKPAYGLKPIEVTQVLFYREYCPAPPVSEIAYIGQLFREEHDPADTEVEYYGDDQGLNRIEGLGSTTRYTWVEEAMDAFLHSYSRKVKRPNVGPNARIKLVNDILADIYPDIEVYFDVEMTHTIEDFESVKLGPEGKSKPRPMDKTIGSAYEKVGHETDCAEYVLSELFKDRIKKR